MKVQVGDCIVKDDIDLGLHVNSHLPHNSRSIKTVSSSPSCIVKWRAQAPGPNKPHIVVNGFVSVEAGRMLKLPDE